MISKKIIIVVCLIFSFFSVNVGAQNVDAESLDTETASEEETAQPKEAVLTFEQAIESAVKNNTQLQAKVAALNDARGQLHIAKGETDFVGGAELTYKREHSPVDSKDKFSYFGNSYTDSHYYSIYDNVSDNVKTDFYVQKLFKFGLQSKLSFEMQSILNKSRINKRSLWDDFVEDNDFTESLTDPKRKNVGKLSLELTLPLLKAFNDSISGNKIKAADEYYNQMQYEFSDSLAQTVMNASKAYWDFLLAHDKLRQCEQLKERLVSRVENVERKVKSGLQSKNDLRAAQISKAKVERKVISARKDLDEKYLALLNIMGEDVFEGSKEIPFPEYGFPDFDYKNLSFPSASDIDEEFMSNVVSNRSDILALKKAVELASTNVKIAKANARPDLNLTLGSGLAGVSYSNDAADYFTAIGQNLRGFDVYGSIIFSCPIENNKGKGEKLRAQAQLEQAEANLNSALSKIKSQVLNALSALNNYGLLVKDASDVLEMQEEYYQNELRRFSSGLITVDEMNERDNDYIQAYSDYYELMVNFLQSSIQYKYYIQNLVLVSESEDSSANKNALYSLTE